MNPSRRSRRPRTRPNPQIERLEGRELLSVAEQSSHIIPGRLIVQFAADATPEDRLEATAGIAGPEEIQVLSRNKHGGRWGTIELVEVESSVDDRQAIAQLREHPSVIAVEQDQAVRIQTLPDDPLFVNGSLYGVYGDDYGTNTGPTNTYGSQAAEAWLGGNTGSSEVVVAVIDTGIDYTHPDLAANIWVNPGEIPGNGLDDDGNDLIDDVHGYDFHNGDSDPMDDHGHGTHVAGTIGAVGNNGIGVTGVNWNVKIIGVKFLDDKGDGSISNGIAALDYITDLKLAGINVVASNNSWGEIGLSSPLLDDAIDRAAAADVLVVAAAGNNGTDTDSVSFSPATIENDHVISVAAIRNDGRRPTWSNYGLTSVDLGAPGQAVQSTDLGGGYRGRSGTSMAAPHVAGAVALYKAADPNLTGLEIKNLLLDSAVDTPSMNGKTVTGGRLDVSGAVSTPPQFQGGPELSSGVLTNVRTGQWYSIEFIHMYEEMVVVATPTLDQNSPSVVTRVKQSGEDTIELLVERTDGSDQPATISQLHYVVAESGVYNEAEHGITMEVVRFESDRVDSKGNRVGHLRPLLQDYTNPVVVGQVIGDEGPWSSFWAAGATEGSAPSNSTLRVGRDVGEDTGTSRPNQEIGYLVIEAGTYDLDGTTLVADRGGETVGGIDNGPPYTYNISGIETPTAAVASIAGVNGGDGGWPVFWGVDPVSGTTLSLAINEEQIGDQERSHTNESVAYLVTGAPASEAIDLVIDSVTASTTNPAAGDSVAIDVAVRNAGGTQQRLNVVLVSDNATPNDPTDDLQIDAWSILADPSTITDSTTLWETSGLPVGSYTLSAIVTSNGLEVDTTNNLGSVVIDIEESSMPPISTGVLNNVTTGVWETVELSHSYPEMVVIATPVFESGTPSTVVRIRQNEPNRFDVLLERNDGSDQPVTISQLHYVVAAAGVYNQVEHGIKMEAVRFTSERVDSEGDRLGVEQGTLLNYNNPVVLGQIIGDAGGWSTFWASGAQVELPPDSSTLRVGRDVGEDPNTNRPDQEIAYLVIEAGNYEIDGLTFVAGVGRTTVRGIDNFPPYGYSIEGIETPIAAVASLAGVQGGDGGSPVLWGNTPITNTRLSLAINEDQIGDPERKHVKESVAYLVIGTTAGIGTTELSLEQVVDNTATSGDGSSPDQRDSLQNPITLGVFGTQFLPDADDRFNGLQDQVEPISDDGKVTSSSTFSPAMVDPGESNVGGEVSAGLTTEADDNTEGAEAEGLFEQLALDQLRIDDPLDLG